MGADTPIERLGRLVDEVEAAGEAARIAAVAVEAATAELRQERRWRRWAVRAGTALAVAVAGLMVLLVAVFDRYGTLLNRVTVDASACARHVGHQTLGCENHDALLAIEKATSPAQQAAGTATLQQAIRLVVNQTDCRVRQSDADVLHAAMPALAFTVPATASCPAYKP